MKQRGGVSPSWCLFHDVRGNRLSPRFFEQTAGQSYSGARAYLATASSGHKFRSVVCSEKKGEGK
jgi:hypothetical protein